MRRRVRLAEDLEGDSPGLANPASQAAGCGRTAREAASLPAGMRIVCAGFWRVEFADGGELLARLYELVRIAGEDLEGFQSHAR